MVGDFHWYIFNVADSAVASGMILFILLTIHIGEKSLLLVSNIDRIKIGSQLDIGIRLTIPYKILQNIQDHKYNFY